MVAAIAEIAGTLATLAAEGVGHRDIKPDNLFRLGDQWVIGDFRLVTYPEKNPMTEHGRKLGPVDYMAPEMRQDADTAAPGPADVWALAKTLWVLLACSPSRFPGPIGPLRTLMPCGGGSRSGSPPSWTSCWTGPPRSTRRPGQRWRTSQLSSGPAPQSPRGAPVSELAMTAPIGPTMTA